MAKALPSRAWSGGSLDVGSRHLMAVKTELTTERERMEVELEVQWIWMDLFVACMYMFPNQKWLKLIYGFLLSGAGFFKYTCTFILYEFPVDTLQRGPKNSSSKHLQTNHRIP